MHFITQATSVGRNFSQVNRVEVHPQLWRAVLGCIGRRELVPEMVRPWCPSRADFFQICLDHRANRCVLCSTRWLGTCRYE